MTPLLQILKTLKKMAEQASGNAPDRPGPAAVAPPKKVKFNLARNSVHPQSAPKHVTQNHHKLGSQKVT